MLVQSVILVASVRPIEPAPSFSPLRFPARCATLGQHPQGGERSMDLARQPRAMRFSRVIGAMDHWDWLVGLEIQRTVLPNAQAGAVATAALVAERADVIFDAGAQWNRLTNDLEI